MSNQYFPIKKLNDFLKNHSFVITDTDGSEIYVVKVIFTGLKEYEITHEAVPFVEYNLVVAPLNRTEVDSDEKVVFDTDNHHYREVTMTVNKLLRDFLNYFNLNYGVLVDKIIEKQSKDKINESLILEESFDSITRKVVRDIINIFKQNDEGDFTLPEDISDEMVYDLKGDTSFSINLKITPTDSVDGFSLDSDYYFDDDTIEVEINYNPRFGQEIMYDLIGELNDVIRHELEHIKQHLNNYYFPKEPKKPKKYYSQEHELDAQIAGFKRRAKLEKRKLSDVMWDWFDKNSNRHNLNPDEVKIIIKKLLQRV